MNQTKIDYVDASWNPTSGCTPEFDCWTFCWARRMANRLRGRCGYDAAEPFKPTFHAERLDEPLRMKTPQRIAVSFMGDLFNSVVPWQWQADVLSAALAAHLIRGHTFLFLTKRPENMANTVRTWVETANFGTLPRKIPNGFWFGTSIANQADADERLPDLLQCPGNLWVSIEPMQGPVDLPLGDEVEATERRATGHRGCGIGMDGRSIGWLVAGGGPFPVHPDWVLSVRDQCRAAGVPWWFKSWGEWTTWEECPPELLDKPRREEHARLFVRVGKKAAGCLLEGKEYHELPIERR